MTVATVSRELRRPFPLPVLVPAEDCFPSLRFLALLTSLAIFVAPWKCSDPVRCNASTSRPF